ncbi:MAG: hypothetical protein B7X00_00570, partial [Legionella sp. 21-45-4]
MVDFQPILATMTTMNKGFSFIELIFALVIISIIASMAFPNYRFTLVKTHRLEGQTALLLAATKLEAHYAREHAYPIDTLQGTRSPNGWYTITATQNTPHDFTLYATPVVNQDSRCQTLTFNHLG